VVLEASAVERWVSAAKNELGASGIGLLAEVELEAVVVNESLLVHDFIDWGDVVGGDGLEGHTEDTVELRGNERCALEGGHLSESNAGDGFSSPGDSVLAEVSGDTTAAVLDVELFAVSLVGG